MALDSGFYGILGVTDAEVDSAVATFRILVFHLENEIFVFLFGGQVVVVALPTFFARAGLDEERAILLREPVARGFPSGQVLAVVEGDESVLALVV